MKSEKAIMPMRCVNANPGKYVSIITNFGCHYTCPECIVRNNGLKMSETDHFSTQEPLNKVLCKERPEWVSVSGGGDPLFHWKEHWSFYEGLFHTAERRNVKLEMHTSYLPDSPEVQDFPLNWFERVVYHVHKFDDLLHVKRKFGEIVRVVFVVDDNTMIEKVVYNDFDCAYKSDLEGFNLDDTVKGEVEVKKMAVGIYYMGEILIPLATEDKKMAGLICWSQLAPVEDEIKNNGFIRFYQRKLGNGRTYFVVKNGMRVRAAVTSYSLNEYAEATLQELVAMLAETHTGEQEEHEQTFDNLTDEAEDEADDEKA